MATWSVADHIIIDEPSSNSVHYAGTNLDVQYTIRFEGMAKLWFSSASLVGLESGDILSPLPDSDWIDTDNNVRSVHAAWAIPTTIKSGTYLLLVSGPAQYPCARFRDGKAPFDHCVMVIESNTTLTIQNPLGDSNNGPFCPLTGCPSDESL